MVTDLIIPDGVTSIKSNAFYGCSGLTSIIIPEGVTSVGNSAFYKCNELTSVTIPGSIKSIGYGAFLNNTNNNIVGYYYGTETDWNALLSDVSIGIYTKNVIFVKHTKTTVSQDGKTFSVKPVNVDSGNTVILALYNGNKLVEVQYKTYNGEELPFSTNKSYTKAKVMGWSDLSIATPICDTEVISGI